MSKAFKRKKKQLSSYIKGESGEVKKQVAEQQISECGKEQVDADFLDGIIHAAKELPVLTVSDEFRKGLHERLLAEQPSKKPVKRYYLRPVSGIVAAAAVFVFSVITLNSLPQHPELTSEVQTEQNKQDYGDEEEAVSEAGTATSENSKIGDLNESEILKNTEIIAQRAESDIVRRAEPAPNKSANPQTADFHTESVTEAGAKDVTNDTFQDAETVLPSESPVAPLMTAALPADETMPAVEADTKQVMKASGGGSSARTAMHEAETPYIHYYFSQEGIETARALLEAYQQSDGVYVLSQVTAQKLHSALAEVSGFVRSESIGHSDEETSEIRIVLHVVA